MADDWSQYPAAPPPPAASSSGWDAFPVAPSGRPSRAALPMAKAEELPPEEPVPSIADVPRAALSGLAGAAREIGQAPAAVAGTAPQQPASQPYYTEPLSFSDLLHPSTAAPKIAYSLAKSVPSMAGAVVGGTAGAALAPESGPVGPLVGMAVGAGGVSAVQSLAPLMAEEMGKPGADPSTAYERAIARAGQEGIFSGATMALFGWAPFKQAAKDILFQAFVAQPGAAVAQRGVENVEQGRPVTQGMAEAIPGAVAGTLVPMAAHAAVARVMGNAAAPEASAEAAPVVPRVRTPEEIENEDGIGPEAAQRVAATEAVRQPAQAAASVAPAEATDQATRDALVQSVEPEAKTAVPSAPAATAGPWDAYPRADVAQSPAAQQLRDTIAASEAASAQRAVAPEDVPPDQLPAVEVRELPKPSSSWVVVDKATNKPVLETFDPKVADAVNTDKYNVVPIGDYLPSLNKAAYDWATGQSVPKGRAEPVAGPLPPAGTRPDPGESLLQFLKRRGGLQPGGDLRAMDAHIASPGLVRKSTGMQLDYAREAAAEAGFLPMDSTIADFLDLVGKELKGQKQYGNDRPENEFGRTPDQIAGREEARRAAIAEDVRMAADDAGLNISGATLDHAVEMAARGVKPEDAVREAARFGEGPPIEDIPFGRRLPQPPQSGAPLLGEAERVARETQQREPTIRNDTRQTDMFGRGDAAVQAQAARDAAGPKGGQKATDEGLFAPVEREQPPLPIAQPADPRLAGLPEGARFIEGKGLLGRGRFGVETADGRMVGNLHPTPEAAAAEAREWVARNAAYGQRKIADAARDRDIAARMRGGAEATDADLTHLGFRPGKTSRFDFLSPVMQRLFGISRAKVREAMGDALRETTTDTGAKEWWASPRKALANAARYAEKEGLFAPKGKEQEPLFGRGPGTAPITAYHGSPHDFDQFDISKIGTGEGAQAYGRGLYFAEREGIARDYRDRLSKGRSRDDVRPDAEAIAKYRGQWEGLVQQLDAARGKHGEVTPKSMAIQNKMDVIHGLMVDETFTRNPIGRLYETRLHLDPDKTLDWDRTLSEQPKGVQEALRALGVPDAAHVNGEQAINHIAGNALREREMLLKMFRNRSASGDTREFAEDRARLSELASPQAAAAKALRDAGIEGIRYLDAGSRDAFGQWSYKGKPIDDPAVAGALGHDQGAIIRELQRGRINADTVPEMIAGLRQRGENSIADVFERHAADLSVKPPSRNYVVFDDKLIDIERKYGRGAEAVANGEAPHPEAVRAAVEAAQQIAGKSVKIETYDAAHDAFRVRFPDGHTEQVFGYTLGRLIRAAIEPERTAWNLNHEAVHALEALGVFKPGEIKALEAAAKRGNWVEQHRIAERYPDQSPAQQLREAIAEEFARYSTTPRATLPIVQRLGAKVAQFIERLRNALAGRGFRSAEDVFGAMQRGEVGAREPASHAPTLAASQDAARRFEAQQGRRPVEPEAAFGRKEKELPGIAAVRERANIAKRAADEVKQLFAPTSRGPQAKAAEHLIRASAAERARSNAQSTDALERLGHTVARLPEAEQLAITDRRERGEAQPNAQLNHVIDTLRGEQGKWAQKIRSLGPEYLKQLRENYMGHIWANYPEWKAGIEAEEAAAQTRGEGIAQAQARGKSPLKGSGAFLKQRTFDTQREGMDAGLIPVTTNPIEMQLLKLYEMQRFYHGVKLADDIKNSGLAHWVSYNEDGAARQAGWVKLDDATFQPRVTEPGDYGRKEYGNWWAPDTVARVFNNYVSRGLAGHSSIYDAVRGAGNALNSAQLSMSGFHATFIAFDTMMSKLALGIQQLSRGEPIRGLGTMAKGLSPTTIFSTVAQGAKLRAAYLHPEQATPEMRRLVQALVKGGGRIAMDPFYRSTAAGSFIKSMGDLKNPGGILHDAWQMAKDTPIAAPMRIVGRLMDTLNEPLMGQMVPRAKLGVFSDLASDFLRRNPEATDEQLAAAMTKAWDSVDNRMGQLAYDNLFWNKTAKDLAFITTRSVGWNLGSVREIGGGGVDAVKAVADMARGRKPELSNRMAYTIAMPIITGLYGAILNYAMTGQGPQSLLDYFYPRTGSETSPGVPDRTTMPGYIKDVMAFKNDPLGTIGNKTQPLIETGIELAKNRDYYGGIIHMPGVDNPAVSYPEYLLNQAIPFSWRGWMKTHEEGASSLTQALNFFGIQPAPKSITNPERGEAYQMRQDVRALKARAKENARGRITMGAPP